MTWLVTGGAGYIGAHVVSALRGVHARVAVVDNLSSGDAARVPADVPLVRADIADAHAVGEAIERFGVTGLVHLAGQTSVEESLRLPQRYYRDNTEGTRRLLELVSAYGISSVVLASTAAVYGDQPSTVVHEDAVPAPLTPYGRSKLASEWMLADLAAASAQLRYIALRLFNVAGTDVDLPPASSRSGLVPALLDNLLAGRRPHVFGVDYDTADGSCVRDYVHVCDVADAFVAAARAVESASVRAGTYNVGTSIGTSVLDVLAATQRAAGTDLPPVLRPRRPGDAPAVVARTERITAQLGWVPRRDVPAIVTSEWQLRQAGMSRVGDRG